MLIAVLVMGPLSGTLALTGLALAQEAPQAAASESAAPSEPFDSFGLVLGIVCVGALSSCTFPTICVIAGSPSVISTTDE